MTQYAITRWRPRLTLRGMFVLIAVLGLVMGWGGKVVNNYRQERRAVDYLIREYNADTHVSGRQYLSDRPYLDITEVSPQRIHRPVEAVSIWEESLDESFWQALLNVRELGRLDLYDCDIQTTGDEFSRLGSLKLLTITNTKISPRALRDICQVQSLIGLYLDGASVDWSEADLLAGLENLEVLDLRQSNISDDALAALAGLPKLWALDLGDTNITDQGIANLANCRALKHLHLFRTQITDQSMHHLARLPLLESLNISDTAVTNQSLEILATSNSLKRDRLGIQRTAITAEEFDRFRAAGP